MLVTLNEVKEYLVITSNTYDNALSNAISYASSLVESYCGRAFAAANVTEYHNGGSSSVFVKKLPINNVWSVAEYDGSTYVTLSPPTVEGALPEVNSNSNAAEYIWNADTGEIQKNIFMGGRQHLRLVGYCMFSNYPKGVKVNYNAGYTSIPMDLRLATLDLVKDIHKKLDSKSATLQGETLQKFDFVRGLPPHITRVLDLYRIQC